MAEPKFVTARKPGEGESPEDVARDCIAQAEREQATKLDLSDLGLTALPREIGRLTSLTKLDLSGNELTALPPEIGKLTSLTTLKLSANKLTALPPEIGQLASLTALDLSGNQLTGLPPEIGRLTSLTTLALWRTKLTALPRDIGDLTGLRTLYLWENKLTTLPPEIGRLTSLTELWVGDNQLTALPPEIGGLTSLSTLDLDRNQLTALPPTLRDLGDLRELHLHGNDALGLPPEVLGPSWHDVQVQGNTAATPADILDYYFRRQAEAKRRLNEAKLLLVGQGGVGKTSVVRYLVHNEPAKADEQKTEGINITTWQAASKVEAETIRLNVWDFGGQEIMHATHQFFLTRRSLYLLILDARKGENEGNIHYWLRIIQSYGGDSPVIVVTNQCDGPNDLDLNEHRLQADYPNIRAFIKTSCTTGRGIEDLRTLIASQVNDLPHVFDELPESYFTIKQQLADRAASESYLDVRDYQTLCRDNSVTEEAEQQRLLRFLHDLGTVLNYNDPHDPYRLRDTHILNPKWVTEGVYSIVNHPRPRREHGVLDCDALGDILEDDLGYPLDRREFIVGMMGRFELCFGFPDAKGRRVLIPELLPKNEPEKLPWEASEALRFEYHYKVLPGGLLPRFIVRTQHRHAKPPVYWRSGVVLEVENCRALVRGDTDRGRVFITIIEGPRTSPGQRRRALSIVRDHFRAIHATIPRIEAVEHVALPDDPGVSVAYEYLLDLEADRDDDFRPPGAGKRYSVRELLEGIEEPKEREAYRERMRRSREAGEPTAHADVRAGIYAKQVFIQGDAHMQQDQSRNVKARDIIGSTINLGEIKDSVVKSIARMPAQSDETAAQLKPLLERLTELLSTAPDQGVEPEVAKHALEEVETIADAAQQPKDNRFVGAVRKTLRTLRGIGAELKGAPTIAAQFKDYVDQIGDLMTG